MGKSRNFIAGTCVLCIAIGYIAGKGGKASSGEDNSASQPSSPSQTRSTSRESRSRSSGDDGLLGSLLAGRSASQIPAAELAEIIARLSKHEPGTDRIAQAKKAYQLAVLLASVPADELEELAGLIQSDPAMKDTGALHEVISAFTTADPHRALVWASSLEDDGGILSFVISSFAGDDPHGAAAMLREALLDGRVDQESMWSGAYGICAGMAKLGAVPLLDFAESLPNNQYSGILFYVMRSMSDEGKIDLLDEIQARGEDSPFELNSVIIELVGSSPALAQEWLERLDDGKEKTALRLSCAESLMGEKRKEEAGEWFARAISDSPGKEKELLQSAGESMIYGDPEGFAYFASLMPAEVGLSVKDLQGPVRSSVSYHSSGFTAIADVLPNPDDKAKLVLIGLKSSANSGEMSSIDLEIVSRRIDEMGFSGENAEKVSAALEKIRLSLATKGE